MNRLVRAGLATAVVDGAFSSVLAAFFYGSTATRLWQGVASTLMGPRALQGGTHTATIGVLMHLIVAFTWSAIFVFGLMRLGVVQRVLASPLGVAKVAAVYGPIIWLVMSLVVIPTLTHRPPTITYRWWVQFFGHIVFVALPMIWAATRDD
ncbi:MAG TPA: hypothetical protein VM076_00245 [Gemmatimonadaceae bacterium]|nr:hypothetical protein [Gemmatimonadaceae bacterium]